MASLTIAGKQTKTWEFLSESREMRIAPSEKGVRLLFAESGKALELFKKITSQSNFNVFLDWDPQHAKNNLFIPKEKENADEVIKILDELQSVLKTVNQNQEIKCPYQFTWAY